MAFKYQLPKDDTHTAKPNVVRCFKIKQEHYDNYKAFRGL